MRYWSGLGFCVGLLERRNSHIELRRDSGEG